MLFNVEADSGDRIVGYVVPDGYSGVPSIRVRSQGRDLVTFPANEEREALVGAGRHETGICGFSIDSSLVPDLAALNDVEVFDDETGTLVYRRPGANIVRKKIFRLETHLLPLSDLDEAVGTHFQYSAMGVEKGGRESVMQMLLLNNIESVYLSGKILYRNFAYFIESGFDTIVMLHDPYKELAERLIVLSQLRSVGVPLLDLRENVMLEPVIEYAQRLPFKDEKALRRALRQMSDDVITLLSNPLVRQLTTNAPDEMPGGGAVAAALDVLAHCRLVGCRRDPEHFREGLRELVGRTTPPLPQFPEYEPVQSLARKLKDSGEVDVFLEKDLEVYLAIEAATTTVSTPQGSGAIHDGGQL